MKTLFVAEIDKMRNSHVARILKKYKESGYEILLATAAPDVYVPWIWDGEFVATKSFNNPQKVECRGEDKLKFIYEKCGESVNIVVVLTDHRDDIPLLKVGADKNIIVNPDVKTLEKLKEEGIVYETLRG